MGLYAVLVVTAGALCNYLAQDELRVSDFSAIVMDECHHVTKDHPYVRILEAVRKCDKALQPRILGLSASPITGKTSDKALARVHEVTKAMLGAKFYRPMAATPVMDSAIMQSVSRSPAQSDAIRQLLGRLRQSVTLLCSSYVTLKPGVYHMVLGSDDLRVLYEDHKFSWARAYNLAAEAHLTPSDPPSVVEAAEKVRGTVEALMTVSLLGPAFVNLEEGQTTAMAELVSTAATDASTGRWSSQLVALETELRRYGATARTLVFVEMRHTAELLALFLQLRFPELNCAKLIGQGGSDGMKWRGLEGQGAVLQRFREGATKLIVCTSVLEEGLDVKDCDLVIRFGGAPSLIQLVQSKGRARAESGRLVLICTPEERRHFRQLLEQEKIVDEAFAAFESGVPPPYRSSKLALSSLLFEGIDDDFM